MEGNTTIFSDTAVIVSAMAAAISAFCALLSFLFSRKLSRREMVDIIKVEILRVVSSVQGRDAWVKIATISKTYEGGGVGPRVDSLAKLLDGKKYKKDKWLWLIPVALEELKKDGYSNLLGF